MTSGAKKHSFIHGIYVAKPCDANWDEMTGDDRARFCGMCKLNVYNLSEMTTEEAEALVIEKEGNLCVRFYRRKDGTMLTRDCPRGLALARQKALRAVACVTGVAAVAVAWFLNHLAPQSSISKVCALAVEAQQNAQPEQIERGKASVPAIAGKMVMGDYAGPMRRAK
jgi:hypothetical protein